MIICLGREFGSGGHEIGKEMAQQLGIPFWDKELLDKAIEQSGMPPEHLKKVDERKVNPWLHRVWYDVQDKRLRGKTVNEILFALQSRIILEEAKQGDAIFVGRCADEVLRRNQIERVSLFISAPFDKRVERKMELTGKGEKEVAVLIRKTDLQRKIYYEHRTGRSWGNPSNYDCCINSASWGVVRTAEYLADLCRRAER